MPKIRTGSARGDGAGALLPALRERIARHTLPPGAKLLENDLAREFGVSRAKCAMRSACSSSAGSSSASPIAAR